MKLQIHYNYSEDGNRAFKMSIRDNDNKDIQNERGVKATIEYAGEDDYVFDDIYEYLDTVFDKCFKDNEWRIGSTLYIEQHLSFLKTYNENFTEIDANLTARRKEEIKKEIEELKNKIKSLETTLTHTNSFLPEGKIYSNRVEISNNSYKKWIADKEERLKDVKEGTETYNKLLAEIEKYKSKIYEV